MTTLGVIYANCDDAKSKGATNIRRTDPGYSAKLDADNDGIACEDPPNGSPGATVLSSSDSRTSGSAAQSVASTGDASLAATGSSSLPLAMIAIGFMMIGYSAITSEAGRRWYATADPGVRFTIDQVIKPRRRRK